MTATADDTLLAPMPRRRLGRTGWNASALTLGGVKWDTQIPERDAVALVHRAIELGVNTFDTAHDYGKGESERRLGLALEGRRDGLWINTKSTKRTYDDARREIDESLARLKTNHVDLFFLHALNEDEDYERASKPEGVLRMVEEYRKAGHIRHVGVSGHHYRRNMLRFIQEQTLDAILCPVGLFNVAYEYNYFDDVVPMARRRGMAVLGMKVFGAGRAKHATSREPYLRYSLNQDIDTAVIGCDSIAQLEETVRIVKAEPPPLSDPEARAAFPEIMSITQAWDQGEFNWVKHYVEVQQGKVS